MEYKITVFFKDKEELYHVLQILRNIYDSHPCRYLINKMDKNFNI